MEHNKAVFIQSWWRMLKAIKRVKKMSMNQSLIPNKPQNLTNSNRKIIKRTNTCHKRSITNRRRLYKRFKNSKRSKYKSKHNKKETKLNFFSYI